MLDLDCGAEFDPSRDASFFAAIPSRPGVLRIEMSAPGAQPYLARTADLHRAAERLLGPPDPATKRLNLRAVAARLRYRLTGSKFEQIFALYSHAKCDLPSRYRDFLRLRTPALLKINLRNSYPRCYVTRSVRADEGFYFGPFPSRRSADAFSEGFLDLFKIRRCQIKIRRDPAFPGCIYSEMKMCLAPCFAGCTKEEYDAELARAVESLASSGTWLTAELSREREAASAALDFERAAALHKRLEKAAAALRSLPDAARRIEELDAVILTPAAEEKTIAAFPIHAAIFGEPFFIRFAELSSAPRSVEAIFRNALDPASLISRVAAADLSASFGPAPEASAVSETPPVSAADLRRRFGLRSAPAELGEHLALFSRWFYSKPREGEIFFREKDWPYRRILRACSRLLAPPAMETSR
ncbi:MAG: hypothetical protein WA660_07295 [Candidatus Acidiferrales bacterium]